MKTKDYIIVLGDSHVRAFSYHYHFLPFFLGAAAFLSFLTPTQAKATEKKLLDFLKKIPRDNHLLFCLSSDPLCHYLNHFNTQNTHKDSLFSVYEKAIEKYIQVIFWAKRFFQGTVYVSSCAPAIQKDYLPFVLAYNAYLKQSCLDKNIAFIDLQQILADKKGLLRKKYRWDAWHFSARSLEKIYPYLQGICTAKKTFSFHYLARFKELGSCKIWGDQPEEKMQVGPQEVFFWAYLHTHTKLVENILQELNAIKENLSPLIGKAPSLLILDCKEGFPAFSCDPQIWGPITACDPCPRRLCFAREVQKIVNRKDICFQHMDAKKSYLKKHDLVLCLERFRFNVQARYETFQDIYPHTRALLFFSLDRRSDIQKMKQAGFSHVFDLPFKEARQLAPNNIYPLIAFSQEVPTDLKHFFSKHYQDFKKSYLENAEKQVNLFLQRSQACLSLSKDATSMS